MRTRRCGIEFVNTKEGKIERWYAFKVLTGKRPAPYGMVDGEWKWRTAAERDAALKRGLELTAPAPSGDQEQSR